MLLRFASAVSVASPAAALATVVALLVAGSRPEVLYPLTSLWCIVPAVWGLWSMLAPRTWVPRRLPWWGAILGLLVGTVVFFPLGLPGQVLGETPSTLLRGLGVLILSTLYYCLWIVVRVVFAAITSEQRRTR
jgi:hypothetical protein